MTAAARGPAVAAALAFAPLGSAAQEGLVAHAEAPSGQRLILAEVLTEEQPWSGEMLVVVRLLAPAIAEDVLTGSEVREDMDWACRLWGLPAARALASPPDRVVVEMMAERAPRGESTPGIRRFFETYRIEGPLCIWELF